MIPESVFQRALEVGLNAPTRPTRVRRMNSGVLAVEDAQGSRRVFRGAAKGTGDLVGWCSPDGLHLEVEAKREDNTLSPAQKRRQKALQRGGAVYVWCRPRPGESLEAAVTRSIAEIDRAIAARRGSPCR